METSTLLHAGDVIGFSGHHPFSLAIAIYSGGFPGYSITHVGVVAPIREASALGIWEATGKQKTPCLITGEITFGVQCHDIQARIDEYWGRAYLYPVIQPLSGTQILDLSSSCGRIVGTPYDVWGAWAIRRLVSGFLRRQVYGTPPEDIRKMFCSEVVAWLLRAAELFDEPNISCWTPAALTNALVQRGQYGAPSRL